MSAPAAWRRVPTAPQYQVMVVEVLLRELLFSLLKLKDVHTVYSLTYKFVTVSPLEILSAHVIALHLTFNMQLLDVSKKLKCIFSLCDYFIVVIFVLYIC